MNYCWICNDTLCILANPLSWLFAVTFSTQDSLSCSSAVEDDVDSLYSRLLYSWTHLFLSARKLQTRLFKFRDSGDGDGLLARGTSHDASVACNTVEGMHGVSGNTCRNLVHYQKGRLSIM